MTINSHVTVFAGLPVVPSDSDVRPDDPAAVAWRVEIDDYDLSPKDFEAAMETMLERAGEGGPVALVIGQWGGAYEAPPPIDLFVRLAPRMPRLRSFFLGDLTFEECEISWIQHRDIAPLLAAYPALERLVVRGTEGLEIGRAAAHPSLRDLEIQSGGLPAALLRSVFALELPALERLNLWLGVDSYGGDVVLEDLAPLLGAADEAATRWPRLTALGLRNSEIQDEIAAAVAQAPILPRLRVLDLSLGTFGDEGAESLLAGPLDHLRELDLHHHFMSPQVAQRLVDALPSVRVDVTDRQEARGDWGRFVEVSE
ncbi:STM4015 family protein [Catenuloplanes atrovinosus]|uniref:Leucine-rich repeat domain-containing protein n=1 Tax=Catenuloplanes atrovinosus TaxID=137266 RepID=A0AAE3YJH0_9ACTN|nr:STM4015 family protein [Catenuloplanes atrovinosus]MDR7274924.1 hypothetical protein [Catenuloplanes atrovinosus]